MIMDDWGIRLQNLHQDQFQDQTLHLGPETIKSLIMRNMKNCVENTDDSRVRATESNIR